MIKLRRLIVSVRTRYPVLGTQNKTGSLLSLSDYRLPTTDYGQGIHFKGQPPWPA
jgi:hypothetical protein